MLDHKKRWIYYYDSIIKSVPDDAPSIPIPIVIESLDDIYSSGEAVKILNNDTAAIRIKDLKVDRNDKILFLLIQYTDKNISDPVFSKLETGELRVEPKLEGEGIAVSAHVALSMIEKKPRSQIYLTLIENVPGISRSKIEPFINSQLKISGMQNYKDENNKTKTYPFLDMSGHLAQTLRDDLQKGKLLGVSLIRHSRKESNFDEPGITQEIARHIELKVVQSLSNIKEKLDVINRIKERARSKGYHEIRVKFKKDGKDRTIPIETSEIDAGDALYVRHEQIQVKEPLPQCVEVLNENVMENLRTLINKEGTKK